MYSALDFSPKPPKPWISSFSKATLDAALCQAERPDNQAEAEELFDAIRRHWLLEVTHHYRDVTLAEDSMKTKTQIVSRLVSSLKTMAVNLL